MAIAGDSALHLLDLPAHVLLQILANSCLDARDLASCCATCAFFSRPFDAVTSTLRLPSDAAGATSTDYQTEARAYNHLTAFSQPHESRNSCHLDRNRAISDCSCENDTSKQTSRIASTRGDGSVEVTDRAIRLQAVIGGDGRVLRNLQDVEMSLVATAARLACERSFVLLSVGKDQRQEIFRRCEEDWLNTWRFVKVTTKH